MDTKQEIVNSLMRVIAEVNARHTDENNLPDIKDLYIYELTEYKDCEDGLYFINILTKIIKNISQKIIDVFVFNAILTKKIYEFMNLSKFGYRVRGNERKVYTKVRLNRIQQKTIRCVKAVLQTTEQKDIHVSESFNMLLYLKLDEYQASNYNFSLDHEYEKQTLGHIRRIIRKAPTTHEYNKFIQYIIDGLCDYCYAESFFKARFEVNANDGCAACLSLEVPDIYYPSDGENSDFEDDIWYDNDDCALNDNLYIGRLHKYFNIHVN